MKTTQRMLLVCAAAVLTGVCGRAQTLRRVPMPAPVQPGLAVVQRTAGTGASAAAPQFKCSGTVKDGDGRLAGWCDGGVLELRGEPAAANPLKLVKQIVTETNGAFEFQISGTGAFLVAQKPGLALAWDQFSVIRDMESHLTLTPPAALAGVVVDEADKPVANAEVSATAVICEIFREDGGQILSTLPVYLMSNYFAARTDATGHFRIGNFPTNATAILAVEAPGKTLRQSSVDFNPGVSSLPWRAGQDDIKLVVESAGSIEGKVAVEGGNQPPPVARLTLQREQPGFFAAGTGEPLQSGADGAFHIGDVAAGSYRLQAVFGTNAVPEWVAASVAVTVESGQTTRDVRITAARGGLLEVAVVGQTDHKPLAQIAVNAYKQDFQSAPIPTATASRSCDCRREITRFRPTVNPCRSSQVSASVEAGKTNRVEIEIAGPKKITGIVRQPDGQPAGEVEVENGGRFWARRSAEVKTDAGGKFETGLEPASNPAEWQHRLYSCSRCGTQFGGGAGHRRRCRPDGFETGARAYAGRPGGIRRQTGHERDRRADFLDRQQRHASDRFDSRNQLAGPV